MSDLVKNAADPQQVAKAVKKVEFTREDELNDLRVVLQTPHGRRLIWRLIKFCRCFESIWEQSARIHYNAGQQDVGHFITAEVIAADEGMLFMMMKENKKEIKNG